MTDWDEQLRAPGSTKIEITTDAVRALCNRARKVEHIGHDITKDQAGAMIEVWTKANARHGARWFAASDDLPLTRLRALHLCGYAKKRQIIHSEQFQLTGESPLSVKAGGPSLMFHVRRMIGL